MSPTKSEIALSARRRAAQSGDILVPILQKLLESEVIPEDEHDFRFMDMLVRVRALPRRKGVFSPSMLGSCMRQAWFSKRGEEKHRVADPVANYYFITGNFIHFKWQFAMWKAHRAGMLELVRVPVEHEVEMLRGIYLSGDDNHSDRDFCVARDAIDFYGDGTRPAVEVRVVDGDYGGTIDVLPILKGQWDSKFVTRRPVVVDFKGINLVEYQKTIRDGAKQEYRKQIVGYAKNANRVLGLDIKDCLLISESKSGPTQGRGSPIALHETRVPVAQFEGEVSRRLRTLRYYDHTDEMPDIECVSTKHMSFMGCPFQRHCRDEVLAVQRKREAKAKEDAKGIRPARSRR